jgi:UDP-2,3-diacylglucosamine pyrophosphatase LpxH
VNDVSRSLHLRAVFISDVHLGARACQAEKLVEFLRNLSCDRLFLVGDIVDGWKMKGGWRWPPSHHDVLHQLLRLARQGATLTYIPGNHDDRVRDFCGIEIAGVRVEREAVHETADGRRFLVTHGDEFDTLSRKPAWQAMAGDLGYKALLGLNTAILRFRTRLALPYWSLSAHMKSKLRSVRTFIERFEEAAAEGARRQGFDGVICGHIHQSGMRQIGGVLYANDGDWVESCTVLVEHGDGRLEIVDWAARTSSSMIQQGGRANRVAKPVLEPAPA